jgi:hypothetical protein
MSLVLEAGRLIRPIRQQGFRPRARVGLQAQSIAGSAKSIPRR